MENKVEVPSIKLQIISAYDPFLFVLTKVPTVAPNFSGSEAVSDSVFAEDQTLKALTQRSQAENGT